MNKLGIAALLSTGGAGASYAGYSYWASKNVARSPVTIGQKWSKFWIGNSDVNNAVWSNKSSKLTAADEATLHPDLKAIKKSFRLEDLKSWCFNASSSEYEGKDSSYLEGVRGYCTFDIQDKLTKSALTKEGSWNDANERLKKYDKSLSSVMTDIKSKLSKESSPDVDALKNWCTSNYLKPWLGDDEADFMDVQSYCTTPVKE
ncbi:hypothetical protein MHC_01420 [Mycoplasma haemocanis str. Illinois]|uniref:Uncharacterized protein n=1 Tax=Mycoplasma haemocanis (strain Illinois) TaxID=1111676 RepID=H6N678_MYCHN|nr:hypothetical protein [Mycoplasma haemocanis]AEW45150.1 hypothetical protein MHC_01420 [Mycoplasma haemocanis str. Illinois]